MITTIYLWVIAIVNTLSLILAVMRYRNRPQANWKTMIIHDDGRKEFVGHDGRYWTE